MNLDFAPLEGITGALFRRLHHEYFPGTDRYYMPFFSPTSDRTFTPKERREIFPEYNYGIPTIPQILTKNAGDFLWAAKELHAMGYSEINLNLGCPSGTVTAKGKGSGMLADPNALDAFLDSIYSASPCKISVKTRLGIDAPSEFDTIFAIYSRYPLSELIVHPRVRKDFYRNPVRTDYFQRTYDQCTLPLSYNGSIITPDDYSKCVAHYPKLHSIMIGQGLVSDPFLVGKIKYQCSADSYILKEFHDHLFSGYAEQFQSRNNAAKRMKELWVYLLKSFENGEEYRKKLFKSHNAEEFLSITDQIFGTLRLLEESAGGW